MTQRRDELTETTGQREQAVAAVDAALNTKNDELKDMDSKISDIKKNLSDVSYRELKPTNSSF
jgi:septal ring factor EnvC (AmiA/AmiB activator)